MIKLFTNWFWSAKHAIMHRKPKRVLSDWAPDSESLHDVRKELTDKYLQTVGLIVVDKTDVLEGIYLTPAQKSVIKRISKYGFNAGPAVLCIRNSPQAT